MPEQTLAAWKGFLSEGRFSSPEVVFNSVDFIEHVLQFRTPVRIQHWNAQSRDHVSCFCEEGQGCRKEVRCEEGGMGRRKGRQESKTRAKEEQEVHTQCRLVTWPRKSLRFTLKPAKVFTFE